MEMPQGTGEQEEALFLPERHVLGPSGCDSVALVQELYLYCNLGNHTVGMPFGPQPVIPMIQFFPCLPDYCVNSDQKRALLVSAESEANQPEDCSTRLRIFHGLGLQIFPDGFRAESCRTHPDLDAPLSAKQVLQCTTKFAPVVRIRVVNRSNDGNLSQSLPKLPCPLD